jgi:hypothetical protein
VRELPPLMLYAENRDGGGRGYCDEIESFMRHLPPPGP